MLKVLSPFHIFKVLHFPNFNTSVNSKLLSSSHQHPKQKKKENMIDSLISIAVGKLNTILQDEVALLACVTTDMKKLSSTFKSIQAMLEGAESQRLKKNKEVTIWLEKIKDVAYDVDDIINEWTTENLRSQEAEEGDGSCFSFIVICFLSPVTCFNHVMLRHRIGSRIRKARGRLDDISNETRQLGLSVSGGDRERVDTQVRQNENRIRETSSQVARLSIVGREDDKNKILDLLLSGSSQEVTEVPFVISIVGMGGLGKTSLAKLVYNDGTLTEERFPVKMWVCVSENFDVKQITKLMIESARGSTPNIEGLQTLQSHLQRILHSKRFLLVLDDIWSEDRGMWDELSLPFQAGAVGSRIIITTRSEKVAEAMGSTRTCTLKGLSDDECWLLFSREALQHPRKTERSELEEIGRKIVKKCGGVPLAAKTLGSAMRSRTTRSQWELVLESEIWNLVDVMEGILPALLLSYYDLPPALKQCFAYCSIFPKDWELEKDTIVKLWIAQGFIGSDTSKDMEEIGGGYFDDLLKRSLLQDATMDDDGNIFSVKMHDLVHDLAQFVAGNDCSIMKITQGAIFNLNKVRHSSFTFSDSRTSIPSTFYKPHKLRTLMFVFRESDSFDSSTEMSEMEKVRSCKVLHNLFHHLRCLRALEMSGDMISRLPRTVRQLKQLRYLDLSHSMIEELPEELIDCINLQSLILNFCTFLKRLPREMRKLISLRHLGLQGMASLEYLPKGIGRLTSLQTLTDFIVGGNDGCELGELKHLNLLRGSLHIRQLKKAMSSQEDAMQPDLYKKTELHSLTLYYYYLDGEVVGDEEQRRAEVVLQGLRPHTNLKELEITGYRGSKFPDWMGDPSFSNLSFVLLCDCTECEELPPLWNLPMLRDLRIIRCPLLTERYKEGGDDRHMIAHISDLCVR